jgi:hypothetical protein
MSTEMKPSDLMEALRPVFTIGKWLFKGAKAVNEAAKKREQIEKYKSELREIGLGDIDAVKAAMQQGKISFDDYKTIMAILES